MSSEGSASRLRRTALVLIAWALASAMLWQHPVGAEPTQADNGSGAGGQPSESAEPSEEPDDSTAVPSNAGNTGAPADGGDSAAPGGGTQTSDDLGPVAVTGHIDEAIRNLVKADPTLAALVAPSLADRSDLVADLNHADGTVNFVSDAGSAVAAPALSSRSLTMNESNGLSVTVGLPGAERNAALSPSGRATYAAVLPETHLAVDLLDDASARVLAVIDGPDGATRLGYEIGGNVAFDLVVRTDGGVNIRSNNGIVFAEIDAPWAYDAEGSQVPAKYEVIGNKLFLDIAHGPAFEYPVVADPRFRWGIITGTIYFSRSETSQVAAGTISTALLLASLPTVASQILAGYSAELGIWAASAESLGKCLKVTIGATWSWKGFWHPAVSYGHYQYEAGIRCR